MPRSFGSLVWMITRVLCKSLMKKIAAVVCFLSFAMILPAIEETIDSIPKLQVRLIRASNEPPETSDSKVKSLNAQLKALQNR